MPGPPCGGESVRLFTLKGATFGLLDEEETVGREGGRKSSSSAVPGMAREVDMVVADPSPSREIRDGRASRSRW